jgi:hypothetical protein
LIQEGRDLKITVMTLTELEEIGRQNLKRVVPPEEDDIAVSNI